MRCLAGRDGGGTRRPLSGDDLRSSRLRRQLDLRSHRQKAGGRTILRLACAGKVMGTLDVGMAGIFNLENLTGVIAAAHVLGVEHPLIAQAIRHFLGVRRRQEIVGVAAGVTVVDDFAHHPTAIRETLGALKGRYGPGKLIVAFEPRSATSRRSVFQHDFVDALAVSRRGRAGPALRPGKSAGRAKAGRGASRRRSAQPRGTSPRRLRRARNRGASGRPGFPRGHGCHHELWRLRGTARQATGAAWRSGARRTGRGPGSDRPLARPRRNCSR